VERLVAREAASLAFLAEETDLVLEGDAALGAWRKASFLI